MVSSYIAMIAWLLVGLVPIHGLFYLGRVRERERTGRMVRVIRENTNKRRRI